MAKIHVIVVCYNAERYLDGLLGSLSRMERGEHDVELVFVDNASTDKTLERLHAASGISVVECGGNLGFAAGNNVALRRAQDAGADFAYLLNHDTEVEPDFLLRAMEGMAAEPNAGAVQSLLLLHPERTLVNSTGNAIHFLGLGYSMGYRMPASGVPRDGFPEITYPSGAAVLLRMSALKTVGLFDEIFFMYHEDLDLGWKLRLAGLTCVLAPRSVVYHKYEFSRSVTKLFFMERNRGIVLLTNLRCWSLLVLAPALALAEVGLLVASVCGGWWKEKLRVYGWFFLPSSWSYLARRRRKVQAIRRVPDRAITRRFTSTVDYQEVAGTFTTRIANPLMQFAWRVLGALIV